MQPIYLYIANTISSVLPQSRFFSVRRFLYIRAGINIGESTKINGRTRIHYSNVSIGSRTWIGTGTQIIPTRKSLVEIGDNCDLGPDVMLVAGSHCFGESTRRAGAGTSAPIHIGDGSWVGARATFIAGSGVGTGCIVAAGSLVNQQFGNNVLIAGTPAKLVRYLDSDGTQEK